jgi:hypothetical protein
MTNDIFTLSDYKLKSIFLIFFGPNTLNFPYISEELTDKYHLRKSILACISFFLNAKISRLGQGRFSFL